MPKPPIAHPISQRLAAVHAFGHLAAPPPQTRWAQPTNGRAGQPSVVTIVAPPSFAPNAPNAPGWPRGMAAI